MGKSSSSEANQTTTVETNTTTNIRDIGLTGAHGVDLAGVIESGAVERAYINAGVLDQLVQEAGSTLNQLIGGATGYSRQLVETGAQTGKDIAREYAMAGADIRDNELSKALPWIIGGAVVLVSIPFLRGR